MSSPRSPERDRGGGGGGRARPRWRPGEILELGALLVLKRQRRRQDRRARRPPRRSPSSRPFAPLLAAATKPRPASASSSPPGPPRARVQLRPAPVPACPATTSMPRCSGSSGSRGCSRSPCRCRDLSPCLRSLPPGKLGRRQMETWDRRASWPPLLPDSSKNRRIYPHLLGSLRPRRSSSARGFDDGATSQRGRPRSCASSSPSRDAVASDHDHQAVASPRTRRRRGLARARRPRTRRHRRRRHDRRRTLALAFCERVEIRVPSDAPSS